MYVPGTSITAAWKISHSQVSLSVHEQAEPMAYVRVFFVVQTGIGFSIRVVRSPCEFVYRASSVVAERLPGTLQSAIEVSVAERKRPGAETFE
jgi:hypothetical protein